MGFIYFPVPLLVWCSRDLPRPSFWVPKWPPGHASGAVHSAALGSHKLHLRRQRVGEGGLQRRVPARRSALRRRFSRRGGQDAREPQAESAFHYRGSGRNPLQNTPPVRTNTTLSAVAPLSQQQKDSHSAFLLLWLLVSALLSPHLPPVSPESCRRRCRIWRRNVRWLSTSRRTAAGRAPPWSQRWPAGWRARKSTEAAQCTRRVELDFLTPLHRKKPGALHLLLDVFRTSFWLSSPEMLLLLHLFMGW